MSTGPDQPGGPPPSSGPPPSASARPATPPPTPPAGVNRRVVVLAALLALAIAIVGVMIVSKDGSSSKTTNVPITIAPTITPTASAPPVVTQAPQPQSALPSQN
jgi:hypothetical protein